MACSSSAREALPHPKTCRGGVGWLGGGGTVHRVGLVKRTGARLWWGGSEVRQGCNGTERCQGKPWPCACLDRTPGGGDSC